MVHETILIRSFYFCTGITAIVLSSSSKQQGAVAGNRMHAIVYWRVYMGYGDRRTGGQAELLLIFLSYNEL